MAQAAALARAAPRTHDRSVSEAASKPRSWSRRTFLGAAGLVGIGALGSQIPSLLGQLEERRQPWRPGPYGAMRPDPQGILDLPEGFTYRVIDRAGDAMAEGLVVPCRPDAMACFSLPDGRWSLMRNHENPLGLPSFGPAPSGVLPSVAFDAEGAGGVSGVVLDPTTLEKESSNLVLAGSILNCAGGTSPWGWLSCEESVDPGHGWVFVCDPHASAAATPRPVRGYGRFRHEAAVVDPRTSIAYLSEDREDSCLYRFVPHAPDDPFEGELQAMRVRGRAGMITGRELGSGDRVEIDWVPVREPAPDDDVVRYQAVRDGAAEVARGEGLCLRTDGDRTTLIVSASDGGQAHLGQVLELSLDGAGGELTVLASSSRIGDFDMPDNITVGPAGRVYFCEDGSGRDHVRGIDPRTGEVFDFARNALSDSELAGVCFSPDGSTMFVNLQEDGLTLAIRGAFV